MLPSSSSYFFEPEVCVCGLRLAACAVPVGSDSRRADTVIVRCPDGLGRLFERLNSALLMGLLPHGHVYPLNDLGEVRSPGCPWARIMLEYYKLVKIHPHANSGVVGFSWVR